MPGPHRAIAAAPLVAGDEVLGILALLNDGPRPWAPDELETLAVVAAPASLAIRGAHHVAELEVWAAQLQSIQDLGRRLSALRSTEQIGAAIVSELGDTVPHHNVRVYRLATDELVPIVWRGERGPYANETAEELRLGVGEGITGWVAAHGIAQYLPDAAADPRSKVVPGSDDDALDESLLAAPLVHDGAVTGVVVLSRLGIDQFRPSDLRLVEIYASFAAQALANADETARRVRDSEARLATILTSANDAVITADAGGLVSGWNPAAERIFGWPADEITGQPIGRLVPDTAGDAPPDALIARLARAARSFGGRPLEVVARRLRGESFTAELSLSAWEHEGTPYVTAVVRDVTERHRIEHELRASEAKYRDLVETVPAVVYMADFGADGAWRYVSPQVQALLGYSAEEWMGDPSLWWSRVVPEDRDLVRTDEEETWETAVDAWVTVEYRMLARDGRVRWIRDDSTVVRDPDGRRLAWRGFLTDVTDRRDLEDQLKHHAFHDPLTSLANRALFGDRVEHALARAGRGSSSMAVLFIDLDDFKTINDGLGHAAGDELLVLVARRLLASLRPSDTASRLGGDEFAVLLEDVTDARAVTDVAERILAALAEPFRVGGRDIILGASVGIARPEGNGESAGILLRNADVAMYAAKARGKGRHVVFEPDMHRAAVRRLELGAGLRQGLERGEFRLHYQPSIRLSDGSVSGFEALLRWSHPAHGLVPPGEFIAIAEELGEIVRIGRWVLEEACRQGRAWELAHPSDGSRTISVNVSPRQLVEPTFRDDVAAILATTGLDPTQLILEITESAVMDDAEVTLQRLRDLKAIGVRLAIDDFGTGYSSLNYLRKLPVDVLKVDKAFIDGIADGGDAAQLARVIVRMGRTLHLDTVAEGVELAAQAERLRRMGCDLAQGYHFGRPLPADQAADWLVVRRSGPGAASGSGAGGPA